MRRVPHSLWIYFFALAALPSNAADTVDFSRDVRPIFEKNCHSCHGAKKQKGGLRLDLKAAAMRGGDERDILPGKSAESPLIRRVMGAKADELMPPEGDALSAAQIAVLRAWIDQGAAWPDNAANDDPRLDWWSLKPLKKSVPPLVAAADRAFMRSPIDAFILKTLREKKLAPSPEADRRSLLRRVCFDLTGLPPTPAELAAFESDAAPDAYEKIVDRLLASPRYGERWARHWMDAVHFAETHGHDQDRVRPNAWPYRDYLIGALNADRPYGRFIQEQLAADVLFPEQTQLTPALGFIAAGPWDESSLRDIREDSLCRKIGYYLDRDDMVMQTVSTFASSTVHCARCHDHKFDAITQQDYYALQAVFAGLGRADREYDADPKVAARRRELQARLNAPAPVSVIALEIVSAVSKENAQLKKLPDGSLLVSGPLPESDTYTVVARTNAPALGAIRLELLPDDSLPFKGPGRQTENGNLHLSEFMVEAAPLGKLFEKKRIEIARASADFSQAGWTIEHAIDGKIETAWGIHPEEGKPHWAVFEFKTPVAFAGGAEITFTLEQRHGRKHVIGRFRLSAADAAQAEVHRELAALPPPSIVYAGARDFKPDASHKPVAVPRPVHELRRGEILKPGALARPGALEFVRGLPARFELPNPNDEGARRAALAAWLSSPENPLTWRSIVNRVWHYHFGRGIVATPNDFGHMGAAPSHPELLDWLASEFIAHGASLKWLHKTIVTSAVYRQSSAHDPARAALDAENVFLWRMNRSRLDAECVHDAVLQISGSLDLSMGGPSVQNFVLSPGLHVTPVVDYLKYDWNAPGAGRRSVYRFTFRTLPDPFMDALDCADASQLTEVRNVSVSPLQALALLNDAFMLRHSERFAKRVLNSSGSMREQIVEAYKVALLRPPSEREMPELESYAKKYGMENLCRMILNCSEFMFVD